MGTKTHDGFEVYDDNGPGEQWRWRLRRRGRIVADGSEGYSRRGDAVRAVRAVSKWLRGPMPIAIAVRDRKR